MKFLKQTALAKYRTSNNPGSDPIYRIPLLPKDAVVDHDHETGLIRQVIHRDSNQFEGKVRNLYLRYARSRTSQTLPQILRNLADYLEYHAENPGDLYHPGHVRVLGRRFLEQPAADQKPVFEAHGLPCGSQAVRKKNVRKLMMKLYTHLDPKEI